MFPWRAATVTADSKAVSLHIDADARLAAAVGAAARFLGEAAGLAAPAASELQASVTAASREAMSRLAGDHPHLNVTITRFVDRIEVALSQEGSADPAAGLDSIAGLAGQPGASSAFEGVDRIQFEAHEGTAVTRLTKYLGHAHRIV